ncbi:hypothetical protein FB565_000152 [Actinoplanes lutulentus]|uniref:DUF4386 family protein n=1 Tax=Actinoplanes lutulentus TaxID=1287878 RepID=A0A327YWJ6_9ACTN|nr:hypothetical protein [Actinoplanes lutulentus]MBB2940448.1 hypothetical protein [Actinoplanes lutulentus]RAK25820.1 hypothetical protein B0I29_13029 [Actinoplanes lutulentus]
MQKISTAGVRRAGAYAAAGGALTAISGFLVQTVVVPGSTVDDQQWSYPWSSDAVVLVSVAYAGFHLLVCLGLLGFGRSGIAGGGTVARGGVWIAFAGTVVLLVAELASIPFREQALDASGPSMVGMLFGLGTVGSAIGFLMAGVTTLKAQRWQGWQRFTPLVVGLTLLLITGLVMTAWMAASIGAYGIGLLGLGLAMRTQPDPNGVLAREPQRARAER